MASALAERLEKIKELGGITGRDVAQLLDTTPDATGSYLRELRRLEKLNLAKYGYRYRNWKREEGFTWSAAPPFLGIEQ